MGAGRGRNPTVRVPVDAARVSRAGGPIVALGELDVDALEEIETFRERARGVRPRTRRQHATRARTELAWFPEISLDQGISEVVDWIDFHWDAVKGLPHDYVHKV